MNIDEVINELNAFYEEYKKYSKLATDKATKVMFKQKAKNFKELVSWLTEYKDIKGW